MDYIEFLKDMNYASFVTAFAKWILLFLLISIILLIICTRLGLFKRRTKTARILVKTYYIIIPIYFVFFAIKYAPIKNAQIEMNNSIDANKQVITDFAFKFVSAVVSDSLMGQNLSAKMIVKNYLDSQMAKLDSVTKPKSGSFFERYYMKIINKVEYGFLLQIIESKIIEKSKKHIGMSEKTTKALYQTDFNKLFKEGELVELFKMELNAYYRSYFRFAFLIFGFGLLIPAIEIILAKKFKY